jgi:hypothetical protein
MTATSHGTVSAAADSIHSIGCALRDFLVRAKHAVDAEIGTYPTPIPRCDAQFNHVYEQRSRIARTLYRVNGALDGADRREDLAAALAEFATMAPLAESVEERELRERVRMALAATRPDAQR